MRSEWISGSAAALALGGVCLALGFSLNPLPQDQPLAAAALVAAERPGMWMLSSFMLFVAAVALSLGSAAFLFLTHRRGRRLPIFTVIVFLTGMIGMAGHAMLMAFVRAMVLQDRALATHLDAIGEDTALNVLLITWSVGLLLGVFLVGVGLFRARSTPRWVPVLMWAFVASQAISIPGNFYTVLQFCVLAMALTGAAIEANHRSMGHGGEVVVHPPRSTQTW